MEQKEYVCCNCSETYIGYFDFGSRNKLEYCPKCNSMMIPKKNPSIYEIIMMLLYGGAFYFAMLLDLY